MPLWQIIVLAIVQGLAELLPVSSSAHVIVAEKLLGLDPAAPAMTLLLVMLHTGTMFAVILYFWKAWKQRFFASKAVFISQIGRIILATLLTLAIGGVLVKGIEKILVHQQSTKPDDADIETIFGNLGLVGSALAAAGVLILFAGLRERKAARAKDIGLREAAWIGGVQGLCLPFRGFSRSGATISTGLLLGSVKARVEEFSFALAVVLTPPVVGRELLRFVKAQHAAGRQTLPMGIFAPSMLGLVFSFLAGLVALKWLSGWLESGRWYYFGVYCLAAAVAVFILYGRGF